MAFVFVSAAEKDRLAKEASVKGLLEAINASGVTVSVSVADTAPCFRIARKEVPAGAGRWEKTNTVMVFAGRPAPVESQEDSKDAGWATVFAATFRDDDSDVAVRGTYSQCLVFSFSAAEATAAGITWSES